MSTRLFFVVESGTDVRLVEGLADIAEVAVLARAVPGGRAISQTMRRPVPVDVVTPSRLRFAAAVLIRLVTRRHDYDRVLVQGYGLGALAANLAAKVTHATTIMLVCSPIERYYACRREHPAPGQSYSRLALAVLSRLARWNAHLGQRYVVLSEHLADVVRGHGGNLPVARIPVYGVDMGQFAPSDEPKAAIRRRLGLPESGHLVFFSSRVAPEKDAETLLVALASLVRDGRDLRLLHLSGGHETLRAAAVRLGVADRIVAADAVDPRGALADYYRACDLCVQASREEGLGFSPLEALACGVPVVAAAVGGLRETVRDGETGWSYPAGDAAALAEAIANALDRPGEAAARAGRGMAMVRERYARQIAFRQLGEVLEGT